MAELLVDEDVVTRTAAILTAYGHDVVTVADLQYKGTKDDGILWIAIRSQRILVTHNEKDFLLLHRAWHRWKLPRPHPGILVLRQNVVSLPAEIGRAIGVFLDSGLRIENQLYVFHRDQQWHSYAVDAALGDTLSL